MSQYKQAAKSVLIMMVFGLGSKFLGFLREMLIAAKFGSGIGTDTFFIAFTAANLFTSMFTQSLNSTMIPILSEIEAKEGKKGKIGHTNNLLNIVLLLSFVIVFVAWICAPVIVKLLAYGFEGGQLELAVTMMRIGLPIVIFACIVGVYRGFLQSELMFIESSISQYPFNLTYMFYLLLLSGVFGIKGLMATSVLAVGSQILIQVPGVKKTGYKYRFLLNFKDQYIRKILYLVIPVSVSVMVNDLNKVVDKSLASTLVEGSVSALNYSGRLNNLILVIFISTISTVLFPMLSGEATKGSHENLKKLIRNGVNVILLITIPTTVGMIILTKPIVRLAFERGAFTPLATEMTSSALAFYSLGLVGMSLRIFMERVYYSLQDTKTPMVNGFFAVGLNIIFNLILIRYMAHNGLALATSIATTITTGYLFYGLRKRIGNLGISKLLSCGMKSLMASGLMGILVYYLYYSIEGKVFGNSIFELGALLLTILLGASVYLIIISLLKVEELSWFVDWFRRKIKA